jgi:hypothetical protein
LFPWLRCERSKGAGEQYGDCGTCGCGECYQGDWISQPPRCEPCDHCGNWIGPGEPMPPYQMPPRVGSGHYGPQLYVPQSAPPSNGPDYRGPMNDTSPTPAPPMAPPADNPPTSATPMRTTQRRGPNWSNY